MYKKIIALTLIYLFSISALAAPTKGLSENALLALLLIVSQILSIVGIIVAGIKYGNRKKNKKSEEKK